MNILPWLPGLILVLIILIALAASFLCKASKEEDKRKIVTALLILILIAIVVFVLTLIRAGDTGSTVSSFDECIAAGNPAMESYPRRCMHGDRTFTEDISNRLEYEQALEIARDSGECSNAGILTDNYTYNENSKTWWIDLERMPELEKDGCNPACVVWEETGAAEVNWRCTGLRRE